MLTSTCIFKLHMFKPSQSTLHSHQNDWFQFQHCRVSNVTIHQIHGSQQIPRFLPTAHRGSWSRDSLAKSRRHSGSRGWKPNCPACFGCERHSGIGSSDTGKHNNTDEQAVKPPTLARCLLQHSLSWTSKVISQLEMWANAQRDGHPAEYRRRPLFNAAKSG